MVVIETSVVQVLNHSIYQCSLAFIKQIELESTSEGLLYVVNNSYKSESLYFAAGGK